jgi:hypothetical protein
MDRRTFNKLTSLAAIGALSRSPALEGEQNAQAGDVSVDPERHSISTGGTSSPDWKSGQDSPVHDSDRLYTLGPQSLVLENEHLYLAFDQHTGALIKFARKNGGSPWQTAPEVGESFLMFAPTPDRQYCPVLGVRNALSSFERASDGKSLTLVWSNLESEYQGRLDITMRGTVSLREDTAEFGMTIANHSPVTVSDVSWPILGSVAEPKAALKLSTPVYGGMNTSPFWDHFEGNEGYYGTNYPTKVLDGRFILISNPEQGLYVGAHNPDSLENVRYQLELKPGYENSFGDISPKTEAISGHRVRATLRVVHFPFLNPGETATLAPIALGPYMGDWHAGVDIYKRWRDTWYPNAALPAWATEVHSWQQLQINSSADDLRTRYVDLPRRVKEAAENGITAVQLVGWNLGGQDGGNPTSDTDPRLGTTAELKNAIAEIQRMGVRVVLFDKYAWADMSTEWYKKELHKHMASDPFDIIYSWRGYKYQTPAQLTGMNQRPLAAGCPNDAAWRKVLAEEFKKVISLGSSGVLFDEAQHRTTSGYNLCFSPNHGHHVPATIWSGDILLSKMYRDMIRDTVGETNFLFSGEAPQDVIGWSYSLSYFRINPGHIPEERYASPFRPLMIAVTGFNDRDMINRALMYRYIMSYEPFNFKGNISDFPLTIAYGKQVDALRKRYKDYLWDAEFRDTLGAEVTVGGKHHPDYTVFLRKDGKRAVIVVNPKVNETIQATVAFKESAGRPLICASPEKPESVSCGATVSVPPRSVIVVMESQSISTS